MSEFQKMIDGELYNPYDTELVDMRARARRLTRIYNQTTEDELGRRKETLLELFSRVGPKVLIEPPFHCDYGSNIYFGNDLFMNFGCVILDCAEVRFGEGVLCGPNVQIYTATHPLESRLRASGAEFAKPVSIGDRVWLGGGVIVCPGVRIGAGTTIGAGSVVTRDVPANVFAAGNPCRVIRHIE